MPPQFLTNWGIGTITVPYTITVSNDNYLYVLTGWNWAYQSFADHTVIGVAKEVSHATLCTCCISYLMPLVYGDNCMKRS